MDSRKFIPLQYHEYSLDEMQRRAEQFYQDMRRRRTVRDFSDRPVPREIIENCLRAAATAPSGANIQPWHFVVVSSPETKRKIRLAAEEEERSFYHGRAPEEWLEAIEPFGTDEYKPFLEIASHLIVIFAQSYSFDEHGDKKKHYYVQESVGIATGILITAIHQAGLVSLTHTPSPLNFLRDILGRPSHERAYSILVVGYPAAEAKVPDITKKSLGDIATFL